MTKVVYNSCYGGFGLSKQAELRYAELKGITLYEDTIRSNSLLTHFYTSPDMSDDTYYSPSYSRTDPILVQVVEEMGESANGFCADLHIVDIPAGNKYRIDEYDGSESVMEVDDYYWEIA